VLGRRVDIEAARIEVDGVPVPVAADLVSYLLNKPAGVVTTLSDPQGRPTVADLVPGDPRVFPVGRLDYESEGLLVLTNDGELTQLLTHPSHGVPKAYLAEVVGVPTAGELRRLREGIELEDGPTAAARVAVVATQGSGAALELVIHEGRNRQVRRMCEAIGHPVTRLVRTRIGPISDARLAPGVWRVLRADEVRALYAAAVGRPVGGGREAPG
jgi:23S rRNA pseudouridine2605 synthase